MIKEIYKKPELENTYFALEWVKWLNMGFIIIGGQRNNVDRKYIINHFVNLVNKYNKAEKKRVEILNKQNNPDSIQIGIF